MVNLLPKAVRREINAIAHQMGMRHESEMVEFLRAYLQDAWRSGTTDADMIDMLHEFHTGKK